jgi:hypothetical protein
MNSECEDSSSLLAGDSSPSKTEMAAAPVGERVGEAGRANVWRTAGRGSAGRTSPPGGQSGDESPHSKAMRCGPSRLTVLLDNKLRVAR